MLTKTFVIPYKIRINVTMEGTLPMYLYVFRKTLNPISTSKALFLLSF